MARDTEHKVRLLAADRLPNSRNGNPRWRLVVSAPGGLATVLTTMSDASCGYAIGNPGMRPGDQVKITLTPAGRVRHVEAV